jgi:hypothetical protein
MANNKAAEELCERWNKLHSVGTAVTVYKDAGDGMLETVTRSEAWAVCGQAVILVVGITGGYSLKRVAVRRPGKRQLNQNLVLDGR